MLDAWMSTARANAGSSTSGGTSTRATVSGWYSCCGNYADGLGCGARSCAGLFKFDSRKLYRTGVGTGVRNRCDDGKSRELAAGRSRLPAGELRQNICACRAAELAVHGGGNTRAVPLDEVAEFCSAKYLDTLSLFALLRLAALAVPRIQDQLSANSRRGRRWNSRS